MDGSRRGTTDSKYLIMNLRCAYDEDEFAEMPADSDTDRSGGLLQTPVQEHELEPPAMPLRTD